MRRGEFEADLDFPDRPFTVVGEQEAGDETKDFYEDFSRMRAVPGYVPWRTTCESGFVHRKTKNYTTFSCAGCQLHCT
jgi:hypothetical protein